MVFMQTALAKGWYLVVPDYEGTQGAFTAGIQSGQATLNSLRAVLGSKEITGISSDAKTALWGYSGGTIASGWAASLQPKYAPELKNNLVGCALGGWATNITSTAEAADGTAFAGLIPNALSGLISEYPSLSGLVEQEIREDKQGEFVKIKKNCVKPSIKQFKMVRFFSKKTNPWAVFEDPNPWAKNGWGFFDNPEFKKVLIENTAALKPDGQIPEIPMFVYHGKVDEVVPFVSAQRAYDNYCKWGIKSFEFAVSKNSGHMLEAVQGSGAALVWLDKVLNGEKPVDGCQRTERTTNLLYPGADAQFNQIVSTLVSSVFGGKLGVATKNADTSTLLSRFLQKVFGFLFTFVGPIAYKRDGNEVPDVPGLNDVIRLWEEHGIHAVPREVVVN